MKVFCKNAALAAMTGTGSRQVAATIAMMTVMGLVALSSGIVPRSANASPFTPHHAYVRGGDINAILHLNYIKCHETTDGLFNGPEDELHLVLAGRRRSDGLEIKKTVGWDIRSGQSTKALDLATVQLSDGDSIVFIVTLIEEDLNSPAGRYLKVAGDLLMTSGNLWATLGGAVANAVGSILGNEDDLIGAIKIRYSNVGGRLTEEYVGLDYSSPLPIDAIQLSHDGGRYWISIRGITR